MAILTDSTVVLHVPKTGGRSVRWAMESEHVAREDVGGERAWDLPGRGEVFTFSGIGNKVHAVPPADSIGDRAVIATIRHPADWLRSVHGHDEGWHGGYLGDWAQRYEHFDDFAMDVTQKDPGIVGDVFRSYIDRHQKVVVAELGTKNWERMLSEHLGVTITNHEPVGAGERPGVGRGVFRAICDAEKVWMFRNGFTFDYDEWACG